MAMSAEIAALLEQSSTQAHIAGMQRITVVGENLLQVGGIINEQATLEKVSVTDDSGLIAALQTASRTPRQGQSND